MIEELLGLGQTIISSIFPNAADKEKANEALIAYNTAVLNAKTSIEAAALANVAAEAQSKQWLAANWRPITMLTFVALIVCHWFGLNASGISEAQYLSLYDLIKIGLSGYVIGRTVEKTAATLKN